MTVTDAGFQHDRAFILIKDITPGDSGISKHLTIKTTYRLCLFRQSINEAGTTLTVSLTTYHKLIESIDIPLLPDDKNLASAQTFTMDLFGTQVRGFDMGGEIAAFFSKHLDQPARLLFIGHGRSRAVPGGEHLIPRKPSRFPGLFKGEQHGQRIRFNDAAPLLLTTKASEEDTRARVPKDYQSEDILIRFRTNIHVDTSEADGFEPYGEDTWKKLIIKSSGGKQDVDLDIVFRTVRCMSLNMDFETGGLLPPERQLYKLLTKDRRVNPLFPTKPCFGVYAFAAPNGVELRVGDDVKIVEKQT